MKYIPADKLIAEIKGLQCEQGFEDGETERGYQVAIKDILRVIDSLQQEQPECIYGRTPKERKKYCKFCSARCNARVEQEQPEVDLENEIDACWQNWLSPSNQNEVGGVLPKTEFATYARHFYELGQKEMRKRISNPEYNKEVIERMKSEYPDSKEENK